MSDSNNSNDLNDLNNRLRDWDLGVWRLAEHAEARVAEGDVLIHDLHAAGRAHLWVLLGEVLSVRPYDPGCGPEDSAQVTQAVLLVPEGLGIVQWDMEDYRSVRRGPERWAEARRLFIPISSCRPILRVQFLPAASDLIARLMRHVNRGHRPR